MTGIVQRYDAVLRWGFIIGDDGVRYFVHRSDVAGPVLMPSERVEFTPTPSPKGPRAANVRRAAEEAKR